MVCRNQELFTNNCNHGNERLFHINVCDANRKTVENIATRQSKLCKLVIKLIYLRTSCRLFRCRWIRYRWILCHWRWFRCHLFVVAVNQYLSTYFQCQTNILQTNSRYGITSVPLPKLGKPDPSGMERFALQIFSF